MTIERLHQSPKVLPLVCLSLVVTLIAAGNAVAEEGTRTHVSINGTSFLLNGKITYENRPIEGQLINARTANAIFDDENSATVGNWAYSDTGRWDPQRNTDELVAALSDYAAHGLGAVSVNLQGGRPARGDQEWVATAFKPDGNLKPQWLTRADRLIRAADALGMVVILGFFYFGQDHRLVDEAAVVRATDNATDWLMDQAYSNVLVEVANEAGRRYEHTILKEDRVHELVARVQARSGGRLLASTSFSGDTVPPDAVIAQSDYVLMHGNGQDSTGITDMVGRLRSRTPFQSDPKPIVFNEDSHLLANFEAAVQAGASWGYHDRRALQFPPVDYTINTPDTVAFFDRVAALAGGPIDPGPAPDPGPDPDPDPPPEPTPVSPPDVGTAPTIKLDPAAGRAGTTVSVTGYNFARGRTEPLLFGSVAVAGFRADRDGEFATSFTVPAGQLGQVTVVADVRDTRGEATFEVLPSAPGPDPDLPPEPPPAVEPDPAPEPQPPSDESSLLAFTFEPTSGCLGACREQTTIRLVHADGTAAGSIPTGSDHYDHRPRWSPDGGQLAFTRVARGGRNGEVMVAVFDGSTLAGLRRLTDLTSTADGRVCDGSVMEPRWSPDSSHIAFECRNGASSSVLVESLDGSAQFSVPAPSGHGDSRPAWSPDGSSMTFVRTDHARAYGEEGRTAIAIATIEPSGVVTTRTLVSGTSVVDHPRWSPVDDRIVYVDVDARTLRPRLRLASASTGTLTTLYTGPVDSNTALYQTAWAGDGTAIAFPVGDGINDSVMHVVPSDGLGTAEAVSPERVMAFSPAWAPDATRLAFDAARVDGSGVERHGLAIAARDGSALHYLPVPAGAGYAFDAQWRTTR